MNAERRYYGLDALRGSMMLLGILLHASQAYMRTSPAGTSIPTDASTSHVFDFIAYLIHVFRMPLFFVMAGFFAALLVAKRGVVEALKNRCARILLPMLVGAVTILPLTGLAMLAFVFSARFGTFQVLPTAEQVQILGPELKAAGLPVDQPTLGHLWFLYYLMYFYLLVPALHFAAHLLSPAQAVLDRAIASPLFVLPLAALTMACLWPFRSVVLFEGFLVLQPHLPALAYYGSFFVFGYLFHQHRSILASCAQHCRAFTVAALALLPLAAWAAWREMKAPGPDVHAVAVASNALLTWLLIYALIGLFMRRFDRDSPWILYLSNSSYWIYLFHMPMVGFASWCLLPLDMHAFVKYPLVVAFTAAVCLLSYHYAVQESWVGRLLNGVRLHHPWPWQARRGG